MVWLFVCVFTLMECFLAASFLLSFAQVVEMTVSLPLRSFAVLVQGGMSVDIFLHFGWCCWASFSRVVVLGLCACGLLFVGVGGGIVVGRLLCQVFGRH